MKLYELTEQYRVICDLAFSEVDDDGAIGQEFMAMMGGLEGEIRDKLSGCCRIVRELEAAEAAAKAEVVFLQQKAARASRHVDRLKDYMKTNLEDLGEVKLKVDDIFTVAIQANPPAVKVNNLDAVPADFDKQQERKLDLTRIKSILANGDPVAGCELVRGTHLRIR